MGGARNRHPTRMEGTYSQTPLSETVDQDAAVVDRDVGIDAAERRLIWMILWIEILSNVGNGLLCIFNPAAAIRPLGNIAQTEVSDEISRWFGSLQLVIAINLYRSLRQPQALRCLLEALSIGDFIYCGAFTPFAAKFGTLPGVLAPYALTGFMFAARMRLYLCEDWARAGKKEQYSILTG